MKKLFQNPEKSQKNYKLWQVITSFIIGLAIGLGIAAVPSYGTKGQMNDIFIDKCANAIAELMDAQEKIEEATSKVDEATSKFEEVSLELEAVYNQAIEQKERIAESITEEERYNDLKDEYWRLMREGNERCGGLLGCYQNEPEVVEAREAMEQAYERLVENREALNKETERLNNSFEELQRNYFTAQTILVDAKEDLEHALNDARVAQEKVKKECPKLELVNINEDINKTLKKLDKKNKIEKKNIFNENAKLRY